MSVVTNCILTFSLEDEGRLADVNAYFTQASVRNDPGFVGIDDERLPGGWYGGTKAFEVEVALGAFNYLDLDRLLAWLRERVAWERPEWVRLIVMEQDDDAFRMLTLDGD